MTGVTAAPVVRPSSFLITVIPRLLHIGLSLLFVPLLYAHWGEAYALYVTAFALVGFAQIVGEPLQLIYYGLQQDGFRRIFALLIVALASIYMVVLAPAILVYGIFIDTSLQALICFILLPLFSATQQFGKACLIHQNKIILNLTKLTTNSVVVIYCWSIRLKLGINQ